MRAKLRIAGTRKAVRNFVNVSKEIIEMISRIYSFIT